ncbi:MAG: hypothetical protein ABSA53_19990 [Streptosporangiaceae bacterium]
MNREGAETYLRVLAENQLRGPLSGARGQPWLLAGSRGKRAAATRTPLGAAPGHRDRGRRGQAAARTGAIRPDRPDDPAGDLAARRPGRGAWSGPAQARRPGPVRAGRIADPVP